MRVPKRLIRFIFFAPLAALCFVSSVKAETYTASSELRDFYFISEEPSVLTIRTFAQQYGIDSMLWVYDEQDNVMVSNDDYFGLDSYVSFEMVPGQQYRLRAGVCCGDPLRWYGESYIIEPSLIPSNAPETTTTSTTTTSTTTITIAPYYNLPENIVATINEDGSVFLDWDTPSASNYENIDIYVIDWYDVLEDGSFSNGWGAWTDASNTSFTIDGSTIEQTAGYGDVRFGVKAGSNACAGRPDTLENCLYGPLAYIEINVPRPIPPTTTTTSTTTTTTTTTSTTTVPEEINVPTITTVAPETEVPLETPPSESNPESDEPVAQIPQYAAENETPSTTEPEIVVPEEVQENVDNEVANIFDEPKTDIEFENSVETLVEDADSPEEITAVVNSLLDQELTDEEFSTVIDTIFSEPLSDENFSAALDAVFDEPLSDEKFDSVIESVLENPLSDEQFEELVGVLESDTVSEEQVAAAVDSIIESGVTESQATELATSSKVLESIDAEQASEIFAVIDISTISAEEASQIVNAVQDAPAEVRESFEEEINLFQGAIDTYVPLGSSVPISTRRVIIGASALAIFSAPVPVSRRK